MAPRTIVSTFPKLGQARLGLGWPTVKLGHPDMYPLDLLATILATGDSSVLVEDLVYDKKMVSGITSYDDTPHYVDGTFVVQMELDTDKIAAATKAVLEHVEKIKSDGVSEDRLHRAKIQTKTTRAFKQQRSEDVAESMATDFLSTGDPHFSDRYVQRMEAVTAEQIKDVARRYLDANRLLTTAMIPEEAVTGASTDHKPGGQGDGGGDAAGSSGKGLAKAEQLLRAGSPTTSPTGQPKPAGPAKITKLELNDGTTVLLRRVDQAPVVVMSMYSLGGLSAEDGKTNGLGNLAMKLVPRGTKSRSAQQIAEFFDSVGGDLSTTSGNNSWGWSAACIKEDFGKTLEVFADVVRNPVFPDDETTAMKTRVLAAIESQDADWFAGAMRFFRKSYFGPRNSPYQYMTVGTADNVKAFTPEQVRQWYAGKVLKSKRVLAIFGDIDVEKARAEVAKQLGGIREASSAGPKITSTNLEAGNGKPSITVREVKVNKTTNPQAGVIMGFDADPVVGDAVNYPLIVADTLTSGYGYPTGYIFEILRGRGLVYDANATVFPGRAREVPGTFIAYAGCDPKNVNEVIEVMVENFARLQGTPQEINTDWFERTRKLITTSDALENETAAAQAQTAALDELFGLGYDFHEQFAAKINAVTLDDVRAVAKARLRQCVITVSTNDPDAVKVKEGERSYASFPPVDLTPRGVQHDSK
jgi:zinc protease